MLWLTFLFSCAGSDTADSGEQCPADSLEAGQVVVFATGLEHDGTTGTEGLVFSPDGRLFVGGAAYLGGGFVAEVQTDGSHQILAPMTATVGLEWWHDQLVVAVGQDGAAGPTGGLMWVDPDSGAATVLADDVPSANFPVATPWDTLLVSSPSGETVWQVDASGGTSLWLDGVTSPNGMVFDASGGSLFVAQTYEDPNWFRHVSVGEDHTAGAVTELVLFDTGSTQDGVAMDVNGDVYVVLNVPGEVVRITPAGDTTVVATGVDWGASLRFGTGDFDPCSLYVTSLFTDVLFQVGVGVRGAE